MLRRTASVGGVAIGAWTVMAHGSTAQFVYWLYFQLGSTTKWLDAHAWFGFLLGPGLITLAAFWPKLEHRLPPWLWAAKPTTQQLNECSARIDFLKKHIDLLNLRVKDINSIEIRIGEVEQTRLPVLRQNISDMASDLKALRDWAVNANILARLDSQERRITMMALVIHKASWGPKDDESAIDVTSKVRRFMKNGILQFKADVALFGDPPEFQGKPKSLYINYSDFGERDSITIANENMVSLPLSSE